MAETSVDKTRTPASFPMTELSVIQTGEAMRLKYRIEPCVKCGGPEVFSKFKPLSRCFRCGNRREYLAPKQHKVSWRRCALCDRPNMAGRPLATKYCVECAGLSSHERSKQLRWKAERASGKSNGPTETSIESAISYSQPAQTDPLPENGKTSGS